MVPAQDNTAFRMTRQREVILGQLRKTCSHPTAADVYRMVRRQLPRISLGTVYRNLEMLAEAGLIRRLDIGGRQRRYDGNCQHHYHVRCERCGSVGDVFAARIAALESALRGTSDFDIVGYRLELIGLCPRCRASSRHAKRPCDAGKTEPEGPRGAV